MENLYDVMEVFRHARKRSRYHSLEHTERKEKAKENHGKKTKHSKKNRIYHDLDKDWGHESHELTQITINN